MAPVGSALVVVASTGLQAAGSMIVVARPVGFASHGCVDGNVLSMIPFGLLVDWDYTAAADAAVVVTSGCQVSTADPALF